MKLGIPALLGALGVIGAGIYKNFFTAGAKRNKIRRLEQEMTDLISNYPKNNRTRDRIMGLQSQLAKLNSQLKDMSE